MIDSMPFCSITSTCKFLPKNRPKAASQPQETKTLRTSWALWWTK